MAYHVDDTIVAVASPPGGAARAIVRLSGPTVLDCVERLFRPEQTPSRADNEHPSRARKEAVASGGAMTPLPYGRGSEFTAASAFPGNICLPGLHCPLPADLYLWPDGRSYTGQPVAEFHTLGSPPLVDAVVRAACDAGARPAKPGEFTLRAFLAGRIDLAQAEAVLGVIDAAGARQLDVALAQLAGGLSRSLANFRDMLLELVGHLEAGLDFADEDLPFITADELFERLAAAGKTASDLQRHLRSRHRADHRTRVVLVGRPNAGKSSLFNALARNAGAIVSHDPGTTRDYLSADIDLEGVRFQLIDTAGVHPTHADGYLGHTRGWLGQSEAMPQKADDESLRRAAEAVARRESAQADVRIHCVDITQLAECPGHNEAMARRLSDPAIPELLVLTKADLLPVPPASGQWPAADQPGLCVSSVTGQGLDALRDGLRELVADAQSEPDQAIASTAARCGQSLRAATEAIDRATETARAGGGEELVAAELRVALEAIGQMAGTVHSDDVLDRVFSRFCIGK